MRKRSRREFLQTAAAVLFVCGGAQTARAHAKILRSQPANGAKLREAPRTIELWFNELLDDEFNSVDVFPTEEMANKARRSLSPGKPRIDSEDRTHLSIPLPVIHPGSYAVEYHVLSRDGHSAPGRFTFSLEAK